MTEEERWRSVERRLDEHGKVLAKIETAINSIAVQDSRLKHLEENTVDLYQKWNSFVQPDGPLSKIKAHQASCPRGQIKFFWYFAIAVAVAIVGLAGTLFKMVGAP